jgi:hypothetical protein
MKVYSLTLRNRFAATLLLLGLIGLGAAVLFVGFALLAGLAAAGAIVGTTTAIYSRLRGRNSMPPNVIGANTSGLDPALEVFATTPRQELPPG